MTRTPRSETTPDVDGVLYTFGGDEWIVVQLAEAMSLPVNMRAQAITRRISEQHHR